MIHNLGTPSTIVNSSVKKINESIAKKDKDNLNYKKSGTTVERPVPSDQAEYYYDNNEALANVVDIKKEDIIETNFINVHSEDGEDISFYETLLNNNKKDFSLIIADHALYGAGTGEIIAVDENTVVVDHIPNRLVEVILVKDSQGDEYPLAEIKDYNKKTTGYGKIFNYYYPDNFMTEYKSYELSWVFWYGGGQFNDFYDKPFYLQLIQEILSQIALKELDTKTFNNGNKTSGIVYISKSGVEQLNMNGATPKDLDNIEEFEDLEDIEKLVANDNQDEEPVTSTVLPQNVETLKKELEKAGLGNAFFYEETDNPLDIGYVNLTNNNQEYILKKLSSLKKEVYRRGRIPPERYMDSSNKESMNSHKTVAIWEIYLNATNSQQQDFEQYLVDYLFFVYEDILEINITVPEFEEFKEAKIKNILRLFNYGLITLENAIIESNKVYGWIDTENIKGWITKERFYKGRLLSDLTTNTQDIGTALDDLRDINEQL